MTRCLILIAGTFRQAPCIFFPLSPKLFFLDSLAFYQSHHHSCGIDLSTIFYLLNKNLYNVCQMQWHPTPVLLPGKSHGQRSLVGCSPWGCEELDTTERLHFSFSLTCIGEGNGNPLQCSCLENPRDRGAWWAAVYGVAQSQTRLKRLSSSSRTISK